MVGSRSCWRGDALLNAVFFLIDCPCPPIAINRFTMSAPFTLNLPQGSLRFAFSREAALTLKAALDELMATLKAAAAEGGSSRRTPQPPMEYRHAGEVFLEVFCNPNIWPSPFAAKALITLRDDRIRVTTEAELSQLFEDVSTYLQEA